MATTKLSVLTGNPVVLPTVRSFTPTVTWNNATGLTIADFITCQQIGEYVIINGYSTFTGTGSSGSQLTATFAGMQFVAGTYGSVKFDNTGTNAGNTATAGSTSGSLGFISEFGSPASPVLGTGFGNTGSLRNTIYWKGLILKVTEFILTSVTAYGAGLATAAKSGLINYFDQGTFVANFNTGMKTGTNNFTIAYTRIGNIVTLSFPDMRVTANATTTTWSTSGADVPASLRPTVAKMHAMTVVNTSVLESGSLIVQPTGVMIVYRNLEAQWTTGTANCGPYLSSVTYLLT